MEKQGMVGRNRNSRARLLTRAGRYFRVTALLLGLPLLTASLRAQDAGEVRVTVQTSPHLPVDGSSMTLTLFVEHFFPEEITVFAPPFPDPFVLDRVKKEPRGPAGRRGNSAEDGFSEYPVEDTGIRGTAVEYRFMLQGAGIFALDSFMVSTPRGQVWTEPLLIKVQNMSKKPETPRFRLIWEDISPDLRAGETSVIGLRVSGQNYPARMPEPEMCFPPVMPGMILLAEPVGPQDRAAGLILRLRLVALDAGNLHFPAKSVLVDGVAFEVPALRIPVSPARIAEDPPVPEKTPEAPAPEEKPAPLFPDSESSSRRHPVLFAVFRRDFGNIYRTARNWWDRGYRAEALAELRKHERDHPASSLFLSLRRDAERNMGLARTGDESPRIVQLAYLLGGVFFTLALGLVCFRLPAGLRGKKAIKVFVVLCAAVSVVFFYRFIEREMPGYPRSGVLKETSLRRIPDSQGTVTARFSEGQAGRLPFAPEKTGDWVWISIQDENGAAGWVPKDQVVFY